MKSKLALTLLGLSLASPLALTGCNTVAGMGEDMSATGRAVTNAAEYASPRHDYYTYHRDPAPRY